MHDEADVTTALASYQPVLQSVKTEKIKRGYHKDGGNNGDNRYPWGKDGALPPVARYGFSTR
eukprot:1023283-Pyramimonas_sp.AAC.1